MSWRSVRIGVLFILSAAVPLTLTAVSLHYIDGQQPAMAMSTTYDAAYFCAKKKDLRRLAYVVERGFEGYEYPRLADLVAGTPAHTKLRAAYKRRVHAGFAPAKRFGIVLALAYTMIELKKPMSTTREYVKYLRERSC